MTGSPALEPMVYGLNSQGISYIVVEGGEIFYFFCNFLKLCSLYTGVRVRKVPGTSKEKGV